MKHVVLSRIYSTYLFFALFISVLSLPIIATEINISAFEYNEILKNPTISYIYLDQDTNNIVHLLAEISECDDHYNSPIHLLEQHINDGFSIGRYNETLQALDHAKQILTKKQSQSKSAYLQELMAKLNLLIGNIVNGIFTINAETISTDVETVSIDTETVSN